MVDVLVLGSGVAGLSAAARAAAAGLGCTLLTKGEVGHSTTRYAQGGVAAALTADDSPELHLSDTVAASAGLCDPDAARVLVTDGPERVRELMAAGAEFDRTGSGERAALALAREGGHSTARVVHAGGDATGVEIERALVAALADTGVDVREGWFALDLLLEGGRCVGVVALNPSGAAVEVRARHTLLASGGAGQLYAVTTNPSPATGDGTAMALRAGAPVADLEFVQFHPTALHHEATPRTLISEAVRGEGAVLRDDKGVAFMAGEHPLGDLAPRDVVSRAIATRLNERHLEHLWLDATGVANFPRRFPTIHAACTDAGLDPAHDWLPIAPAAHYHCGGIVTDLVGASAVPGLWAVGEAACTGAHGANRLASNSLLEGLVFSARAVAALVAGADGGIGDKPTGALRGVDPPPVQSRSHADADPTSPSRLYFDADHGASIARRQFQQAMTRGAGVVRSEASLADAEAALAAVSRGARVGLAGGPAAAEVGNLVAVGRALIAAASARQESRGAHTRIEFAEPSPRFQGRFVHYGADRVEFVPLATADSPVS